MTAYRLFGTGIPWPGVAISRAAALGLLCSARKAPAMAVQAGDHMRAARHWTIAPRDLAVGGRFHVVATYSRELSF